MYTKWHCCQVIYETEILNWLVAIGNDLMAIYLLGLFRLKQIKGGILDAAAQTLWRA